ncbi:F-box protein CPR1 [Linum grandiflorum]
MKRKQAWPLQPDDRDSSVWKWKKASFMKKMISFLKKAVSNSKARRRRRRRSSFLPEELVFDILIRIPEKTLLRFNCLSTSIHNLIQSLYFVEARADHLTKNGTGIFLLANKGTDDNSSSSGSFPFLKNPNLELQYVGSCNGLVCLNIFQDENRRVASLINMVLWNPSTSNFCFAPPPPPLRDLCDGAKLVYGFGYDSVSDDFKSIRIAVCPMSCSSTEVLSWGKRSWKKVRDKKHICIEGPQMMDIHPDPVTTNGRANWMVDPRSYKGELLSFKFAKEEFQWLSTPLKDYHGMKTACVWKGSLAMLVEKDQHTTLWLFNDDDYDDDDDRDPSLCWSKLFTVPTDYPCKWVSEPEGIWGTDDDRNMFLVYQFTDGRLALASMAGQLRSRLGYRIQKGFEFTATSVPIPGSSLGGGTGVEGSPYAFSRTFKRPDDSRSYEERLAHYRLYMELQT